jgi:hypothetical protein
MISIEIEKEIVSKGMPLNVKNRVHKLSKRIDRQSTADLGMRTVEVLQIPNLIFCILCNFFQSFYVFSLDEQLVVSPEFNKRIEVSYSTAFQLFLGVIYYLNRNHRFLNLFNHFRVEAGLLLRENSTQILVINDFII